MIQKTYIRNEFQRLVKMRYYDRGISPNTKQLDALWEEARLKQLGANGSRVSFTPDENSNSSASDISETVRVFDQEVSVISTAADELKDQGRRILDRADNNLALIGKNAVELTVEACQLELARRNGLVFGAGDALTNLNKVDQTLTSTTINPETRSATLKRRSISEQVDLSNLRNNNFSVRAINSEYIGLNIGRNNNFVEMLDDTDGYWLQRLTAANTGEKTIALEIDLKENINFSGASLKPLEADTLDPITIRILASQDGARWREVALRTLTGTVTTDIEFTPVTARFVRIQFTKTQPSYETNTGEIIQVYEFGLEFLKLVQARYYPEATFVSEPIQFKDGLGNVQAIDKIRFDVQDERPSDTDIVYYITRDTDDSDLLIRIEPGTTLDFNIIGEIDDNQLAVRQRFDTNHALINRQLDTDFIPETVEFFRNTFQQDVLIDGIQSGWKFENSYYSCIFEIAEELEVNLGINFAFIDGRKRNGIQVIQPGIHTFRTHEVNWRPADNEEADTLFPSNHKLLIEGLDGSSVYPGVDFQAAQRLKLVSTFDLINNIPNDNTDFFAIHRGLPLIKVPSPPVRVDTIEGWRLEQHGIRYKFLSNDVSPVRSVRFIAKLSTQNTSFTPKLKGYVATAGY